MTPSRPGAILLEVVLALSLFVSAGLAITSLVSQSMSRLAGTRSALIGADLARSAMAQIEAGIAEPESLNGPVEPGSIAQGADDTSESGFEFDEEMTAAPTEPSGWELEIDTEPAEFSGLTRVTIRAFRRVGGYGDRVTGSYELVQLVRLGEAAEDTVGEVDPLVAEALRGAADAEARGRSR